MTAVVPTYRCGAAPESHRVPSCRPGLTTRAPTLRDNTLTKQPVAVKLLRATACALTVHRTGNGVFAIVLEKSAYPGHLDDRHVMDSQVSTHDRLSQVLADYLEALDTVKGDASRLQVLRDSYLDEYADLGSELKDHFEHEDAIGRHLVEGEVLPSFGRYSEVTRIGHGAMGIVYKAFDRELERWVALKIPSLVGAENREARRFRIEAQSMAQLEHRNIVRVFDVTEYEGRPVLSMALVSGGSLDQHLDRLRKDQRSLTKLMVEIARAVHHAHQRGILHRDLKPSNILLDTVAHGPDHPYVSDFGLAKPVDVHDPGTAGATQLGQGTVEYGLIVRTASYMSPEQARADGTTRWKPTQPSARDAARSPWSPTACAPSRSRPRNTRVCPIPTSCGSRPSSPNARSPVNEPPSRGMRRRCSVSASWRSYWPAGCWLSCPRSTRA